MDKAVCGELAMPDRDLLEVFLPPDQAILAHPAKVKGGNPETFAADFRVPGVKSPEKQIRFTVGQTSRLNRMRIVNKKQENIPV